MTYTDSAPVTEKRLLVNGSWIAGQDWASITSPYSGAVIGRVPNMGARTTRAAIDAAAAAMRSPLPAWCRGEILDRTADLIDERREELARLIVDETGKPIRAARLEIQRAAFTYRTSAAAARTLSGQTVPIDASPFGEKKLGLTLRIPVGVVAAITPFNFPSNLVAHKIAPALAAGCAVVLKPAPQSPMSAIALAELETEAGLPAGWLNVVFGPAAEIGDALIEDPRVAMITFTGSTRVGWMLRERAPRKHVALELGNTTPVIVEADADLPKAAERIARTAFAFSGQACTSVQRIYVQHAVRDSFLDEFLPRVAELRVGDPNDEETDVGPLIDAASRDRILTWIKEAMEDGAELLAGGGLDDGVLRPTVLGSVDPDSRVCREEVFAPLVVIAAYEHLDDAIESANATEYGLQAGIFTRDVAKAFRAASELSFGGVIINESPSWRVEQMPYGGVKASGIGKEGPIAAAQEMTVERLVVLDLG